MAPKPTLSGQTYYPSLDGLRGLAILLVLLMHLFPFITVSRFGWIGVDLFFVLSGFLITNILLAERRKSGFVWKFYARRWLRTMPLYVLSLVLLFYIVPRFVSHPEMFGYLLTNQAWFWFQLQNLLFFLKPDGNPNILNHFWSLAVEEQFYLLVPVVVLLVRPARILVNGCLFALISLQVARMAVWFAHLPGFSYEMCYSFTRIDGLCIGTLISLIRSSDDPKRNRRIVILLAAFGLFVAAMFFCRLFFSFPLPLKATCVYPCVAIGWGFVLMQSLQPAGWLQHMLQIRILAFAGRISYGWYVIHQPLHWLLLRSHWHAYPLFQSATGAFLFSLGSVFLSGVIAVASFYLFERPLLRLKNFFV